MFELRYIFVCREKMDLLEVPTTQYEPQAQYGGLGLFRTMLDTLGGSDMTAILIAAKNGDLDAIKLLLEKGADVGLNPKYQSKEDTSLHIAAEEGHWEIVQFLLDQAKWSPGEIKEALLQYSSKMMINKKLQEKVSTLSKI